MTDTAIPPAALPKDTAAPPDKAEISDVLVAFTFTLEAEPVTSEPIISAEVLFKVRLEDAEPAKAAPLATAPATEADFILELLLPLMLSEALFCMDEFETVPLAVLCILLSATAAPKPDPDRPIDTAPAIELICDSSLPSTVTVEPLPLRTVEFFNSAVVVFGCEPTKD